MTIKSTEKIPVAILGATGSVGQKFVELLQHHPWFKIAELTASERSAGKPYGEAMNWIMSTPLDPMIAKMTVKETYPDINSKIVFSALDSSVAGKMETDFANQGYFVISNARNHRFDPNVPLIIPEVNADHLDMINTQNFNKGGAIVTNPNCSTIGMVLALKPLHDELGIEALNVVTMQAVSGSGYPGLSVMDMLDNVQPYISGEEDKLETEPLKILGKLNKEKTAIEQAEIDISAQCNRVGVLDGHVECMQVRFSEKAEVSKIIDIWKTFRAEPQELDLPSAPVWPIHYFEDERQPQPRMLRNLDKGMAVSIGRLRACSLFDCKFVILSHNTVRGAAGGTLLIAEMLLKKGYLD